MINWINELVNKDGVRLGDDNVKLSVDNSKSASNSTIDPMYNPETGDQLKNATAQQRQQGYRKYPFSLVPLPSRAAGNSSYGSATVYGTSYMDDEEVTKEPTKLKKKDVLSTVKNKLKNRAKVKKNLEEASKQKMEEYVEDIVGKNFSKDVLDTVKSNGDIRRNGVPDIDVLGEDNPEIGRAHV